MSGAGAPPLWSLGELMRAGRALTVPFRLRLLAQDRTGVDGPAEREVLCLAVERLLPGRRLVARVQVQGRSALLKLFLGAGARRYQARERRGCRRLASAGVATPALLEALREPPDSRPRARALLFEYVPGARPLRGADQAGVEAAAAELARLHAHGCRHGDLHLDNFLLPAGAPRPYLIDGDAVQRAAVGPLGRRRSLEQLAVLCAQRTPLADRWLADVYRAYAAARRWPLVEAASQGPVAAVAALAAAVRRQRRARLRRYARKAQRNCTEFVCRRDWHRYLVAQRGAWGPHLSALLADPEGAFAGASVLKAGNSATVVRGHLGERPCVLKRYNLKGPWHALRRNLRPLARFRRSWINGQLLHMLEIPTARPLALVERRFGPLRGVAYLVMPDLGSVDLAAEVAARGLAPTRLAQVVELFRALQAAELCHGDTKASNFLVDGGGISLVDLDAMRVGVDGLAGDVRRFLANFDDQPAVRARLRDALAAAGLPGTGPPD